MNMNMQRHTRRRGRPATGCRLDVRPPAAPARAAATPLLPADVLADLTRRGLTAIVADYRHKVRDLGGSP